MPELEEEHMLPGTLIYYDRKTGGCGHSAYGLIYAVVDQTIYVMWNVDKDHPAVDRYNSSDQMLHKWYRLAGKAGDRET